MTNAALLLSKSTFLFLLRGTFFLLLLFTFCFFCIHLITYFRAKKEPKPPPPEPEKEKAPIATQPEPVYYIVERKKVRSKAKYGEPKEIKFK